MSRRILAVLGCIMIGISLGGVLHAKDRINEVRRCEETDMDVMECDDNTTCYYINGEWICEPDSPPIIP